MRFPVNYTFPLSALVLLGANAAYAAQTTPAPSSASNTGPAADYPVVVGEPFTIGSTVWTPLDQLNYDAVGRVEIGSGTGVTGAHKTLPLPCYVEVTSLESGRTILVRLERRGPMNNNSLIEISGEAAAQLGMVPGANHAVRVRRVNPPEQERAMLRQGGKVPERMATPAGLLKVLNRKLTDQSPITALADKSAVAVVPTTPKSLPLGGVPIPPASEVNSPVVKTVSSVPQPARVTAPIAPTGNIPPAAHSSHASSKGDVALPASRVSTAPSGQSAPPPPARVRTAQTNGPVYVQVAAFSVEASARKVAAELGGTVSQAGKFWRVRIGGFRNRAQAAPALEKAKAAGYRDSRILSAD